MTISARRTATVLSIIALSLFAGSLLTQADYHFFNLDLPGAGVLLGLFNMDSEIGFNNTFATFILFVSGLFLTWVSYFKVKGKDSFSAQWSALSIIFFYLAIDEGTALHDRLTPILRRFLNAGGLLYQSWIILAVIILLILAVYFFRFIVHLPKTTRNRFLIAAFLYVGGALVIEMLGGQREELNGADTFEHALFYTTEESLELSGLILFLYTTMRYLVEHYPKLELTVKR